MLKMSSFFEFDFIFGRLTGENATINEKDRQCELGDCRGLLSGGKLKNGE